MDALSATGRVLCRRRHSCDGEPFSAPQHRPGDSCQLVGEGNDGNVAMGATYESLRPSAERRVALSHIGQSRARSMDQLPAQVFVAALADPEQLWLAAGRELTGNQAEPRSEIAPALEALSLADGGDKGGWDDRANAWDCRQPASLFVLLHPADELGIEGCDPSIDLGPLRPSVGDEHDHPRAQSCSALLIHQHGQELLELPLALRRDYSSLQQNGAQLIDQSCPLPDQPVSRSMKRLHVKLILALQL